MEVFTTKLESVLLIKPPTVFEDFRDHYIETYNRKAYFTAGIPIEFIQDDISMSHRHVLRGIHGDTKTWKLISCLQGSFYMVVVNNDPSSSQYRQWEAFTLSDTNRLQVLVPPNFGNGHAGDERAGDLPLQAEHRVRPRRPVHAAVERSGIEDLVAGHEPDPLGTRPGVIRGA